MACHAAHFDPEAIRVASFPEEVDAVAAISRPLESAPPGAAGDRSGSAGPPSPFMAEAIALARQGEGRTAPNPPVGAVVVREGRVVGRGFHPRAGEPHAEAFALEEAGELARGADLYVTLEPCPHHGRTPPCTEAIAAAGVARVVCAGIDPNPAVLGRGVARLRELGVAVEVGDGASEAAELTRFYARHVRTGLPYTLYKYAISLDGRVAAQDGVPLRLTGPQADAEVHALRDRVDAVAVGVGTAIADDPLLTTRRHDRPGRDALRVVVDSHLRLPASARMLRYGSAPVLVACRAPAPAPRAAALRAAGAEILEIEGEDEDGGVPLAGLLAALGKRGVMGLLVEGGPTLAGSLARADALDEVWAFVALRLVGGIDGPPALEGVGRVLAPSLRAVDVRRLGDDLLVVMRRQEEGVDGCSPVSSKA